MTNKEFQEVFQFSFRHARRKRKQFKYGDYSRISISDLILVSEKMPLEIQGQFLDALNSILTSI